VTTFTDVPTRMNAEMVELTGFGALAAEEDVPKSTMLVKERIPVQFMLPTAGWEVIHVLEHQNGFMLISDVMDKIFLCSLF